MIRAEKLFKTYGVGATALPVLKGLDLSVGNGEFLAVTGRSGSGKSTLLYQLGLLDHPTAGEVVIDGEKTSILSSNERTEFRLRFLGYIFQDYALIPELTALENVLIPLLMQGYAKSLARTKAKRALEGVGLGHRLNHTPSQLSGGEQQRVSIARAIGHDPKIIFADEPTANLDSETSRQVLEVFLSLHRAGQTIVMVTHESEYAMLADRVIELSDGVIVSEHPQSASGKPVAS